MRPANTIALCLLALCGCKLPLPYTPQMLATDSERLGGRALVHYLGQPGPLQAQVCDPTSLGAHVAWIDDKVVDQVTEAFLRGRIAGSAWSGCLGAAWRSAEPALGEHIGRTALAAAPAVLADPVLSPNEQVIHLDAVTTLLRSRPAGARLPEADARAALDEVSARRDHLDPAPGSLADRFADEVGIDLGLWRGDEVDVAWIARSDDPVLLLRFADRLADPALREAARARVVRLRIAASPFEVTREHADEVVSTVLAQGRWAVSLERFPPAGVRGVPGSEATVSLMVVQDPLNGTAGLYAQEASGAVVSAIDLRDRLWVDLEGIEPAVGPCGPSDGLDPTPCVDPGAIRVSHPLFTLDPHGRLILPESLAPETVRSLARIHGIEIPFAVGGFETLLARPLYFAPVEPLVLQGLPGEDGPNLVVRVRPEGARVVYEVQADQGAYLAVVERAHLGTFRFVTEGGDGKPGVPGSLGAAGRRGFDGMRAVCPNSHGTNGEIGGDGRPGGDGGPGGPGGDGGDVEVFLRCADTRSCATLLELVEPTLQSRGGEGGKGGDGGPGGPGGAGGRGGEAETCLVQGQPQWLQGGYDGMSGIQGTHGKDGPDGPPGRAGSVRMQVVP